MDDISISKLNNLVFDLERCINDQGRRIEKLEKNKSNNDINMDNTLFTISFDELNTIKNTILHLDEKLNKIQNDLDHILRPKDLDVEFRDMLNKRG